LDPTTGQYIIDPQTNQSKKILEQPHILMQEAEVKEITNIIIIWNSFQKWCFVPLNRLVTNFHKIKQIFSTANNN
jgi:hypothetical protein